MKRYLIIQSTFTDFHFQTDFSVQLCKLIMNIQNVKKHDNQKIFDRNICILFFDCKISFLDFQVNGAAFMLRRFCREFFLHENFFQDSQFQTTVKSLQSIRIHDNIVINTMNFDKTFTELLFFNFYCHHLSMTDDLYKSTFQQCALISAELFFINDHKSFNNFLF